MLEKVDRKKKRGNYGVAMLALLVLALALSTQPLASAFQYRPLDLLGPILDAPAHVSLIYNVGSLAVLSLLALWLYFRNLNPFETRRSRLAVFTNVLAPALYLGLAIVAWETGESQATGFASQLIAPLVIVVPPLLVLLFEKLTRKVNLRLGRGARERGWRGTALRHLRLSLAIQPDDRETRRACGLLFAEEDECEKSLAMFETLGAIENSADEEILRAAEQCCRTRGDLKRTLTFLLHLREVSPESPNIDRRILDDYVRLGMTEEAIELLESDRLKPTLDLELLLQRLYVEQGDCAKALQLIHGIAALEGPPYAQTVRLHRDLIKLKPDEPEIKISFGLLLLGDQNVQRRQEGAALLEDVLFKESRRLDLSRPLVRYYRETEQLSKWREHLNRLVEAGEPEAEYYLDYAQVLIDENKLADAVMVLVRMTQILPEDWRGHLRLARLRFQQGEIDAAENGLAEAERVAAISESTEAEPLFRHLHNDIEQHRRESKVLSKAESLKSSKAGEDELARERLDLIRQLIEVERIDQALDECDQLQHERPELRPDIEQLVREHIDITERNFRLRDYLADMCYEQGRYEEMLGLYRIMAEQSLDPLKVMADGCRKILRRAPEYLEARRELALAERQAEHWAGVTEALDPALELDQGLAVEDKALWVEAAFRQDRLADAARVGLPLADALAGETGYMLMMIDILIGVEDYETAVEVYNKARAANPGDERVRRAERRVMGARRRYRMSLLVEKQKQGALSPEDHLEKAELHAEAGETEEAIVHYQRAADDENQANLALTKMAVVLCDRGMYDLADETLDPLVLTREIALAHPELKAHYYTVARAMEKIKRPDLAVKYYKRIFRVDAAYSDIVQRLERYT